MENQLTKMDKAVIGSIILGILIVTSSLAYHWLISIPKKEAMQLKQQEIYTLEEKKNDENYENANKKLEQDVQTSQATLDELEAKINKLRSELEKKVEKQKE